MKPALSLAALPKGVFRLCYVDEPWAYFTTQALKDQWGDDWNDAPYEHNAGRPYEFHKHDAERGRKPWTLIVVAYDGPLDTPCSGQSNSRFSVEQINAGVVAWLRTDARWHFGKQVAIPAGTTLDDFCRLVREAGGKVYMEALCEE